VIRVTFDQTKLVSVRDQLATDISGIDRRLDPSRGDSVAVRRRAVAEGLQKLQDSLDEPNRRFVAFQNALQAWSARRTTILGDTDTPDSISWLEARLKELDGIPAKLEELRRRRAELAREIYRGTKRLAEDYRSLYRPVQEFVEQQKISTETVPLSFRVSIVEQDFAAAFLPKINRQVRGTFSGLEESSAYVRGRLQAVDFDNEDSVIAFVEAIHSGVRQL
jgi:hypothetical protein